MECDFGAVTILLDAPSIRFHSSPALNTSKSTQGPTQNKAKVPNSPTVKKSEVSSTEESKTSSTKVHEPYPCETIKSPPIEVLKSSPAMAANAATSPPSKVSEPKSIEKIKRTSTEATESTATPLIVRASMSTNTYIPSSQKTLNFSQNQPYPGQCRADAPTTEERCRRYGDFNGFCDLHCENRQRQERNAVIFL
ncbi:hypothetical protein BGX26_002024 [Mortierella sp. AD094]|nr:hypothetical protein BGX26_002024 [Mortierella sp. AD094]